MIVYCSQFTTSEFCGHTISLSNNTEIKKKKKEQRGQVIAWTQVVQNQFYRCMTWLYQPAQEP